MKEENNVDFNISLKPANLFTCEERKTSTSGVVEVMLVKPDHKFNTRLYSFDGLGNSKALTC